MKKYISCTLLTLGAAYSQAGALDLDASAFAGIFTSGSSSDLSSQQSNTPGSYSGAGMFGPLTATATATDPEPRQSLGTLNIVSADITSETSGSISVEDYYSSKLTTLQGYTNTYPLAGPLSFSGDQATYTFTLTDTEIFLVNFSASFSKSGPDAVTWGVQNPWIYVDGTLEYATYPPASSGGFDVTLGAGTHTLNVIDNSNLSGGLGNETEQLNETVNFGAQAVPEPTTFVVFGLGLAGLFLRRK